MISQVEFREQCAVQLQSSVGRASCLSAFVGLDGFVDEIIHVVDKRHDAGAFDRLESIPDLAQRISSAAGHSTNLELVVQQTKLGGNGPIMANALARLGIKVTYLGALGYPNLHPVFHEFAHRAEVHSISDPGHTDALEFQDGKIMLGKVTPLDEVTWTNIQARFGRQKFQQKFTSADLIGFVNWTMIPHMSEIWASLLAEACAGLPSPRRKIFFDLADPEKRPADDILHALNLIGQFEAHFDVILGLNEKEAFAIASVLGLSAEARDRDGVGALAVEMRRMLNISHLVIHPVAYAAAASSDSAAVVDGPFVQSPKITTGAGDHFNSGFCVGKLLGLNDASSLLAGVTTSAFYVANALSPRIDDLVGLLRNWPSR